MDGYNCCPLEYNVVNGEICSKSKTSLLEVTRQAFIKWYHLISYTSSNPTSLFLHHTGWSMVMSLKASSMLMSPQEWCAWLSNSLLWLMVLNQLASVYLAKIRGLVNELTLIGILIGKKKKKNLKISLFTLINGIGPKCYKYFILTMKI